MNSESFRVSPSRIGAAVVGLGVGAEHARVLNALPKARLHMLYDLDKTRADELARRLGATAVNAFEDVLGEKAVDLVVVASYDHAHCEQVTAALRAGKHVFAEKPLCQSFDELHDIKRAWTDSRDRLLRSNLVLRSAPLYAWLRAYIADGQLGEIYAFDGDYLYGRIEKILAGWRGRAPGYSALQGGGVHLIDLMVWLTGQKPVSVMAAGSRVATRGSGFPTDDYVAATFQFSSGLVGRITVNLGSVHRHHHVVRIFGTKGTFIYDDAGPRIHMSRDPAFRATPLAHEPLPSGKGVVLPDLVDRIAADTPDAAATQLDLDVMSACLAAEQSRGRQSALPIEYV